MRDIITTDRLVLRPLELSDAPQMALVYKDKDLSSMTGSIPHPFYPMAAEFRIMKMRAGQARGVSFNYALTLKSDNAAPVHAPYWGGVSLFLCAEDHWELGYGIDRSLWGQGIAAEAAGALLAEADCTLGLPYIKAGHFDDNPASGRVLEKLGFTPTGERDMAYSMARLKRDGGIVYSRPTPPKQAQAS